MGHYEVIVDNIVDNIGTVYNGQDGLKAARSYLTYVDQCKAQTGRIGKTVILLKDGEPVREYRQGDPEES